MSLRKKHLPPHIIVLLLITGILLIGTGTSWKAMAETSLLESRILKTGSTAPSFSAEDLEGAIYNLDDTLKKKPILIFFWSFFCGPCREELPVLQQIHSEVGEDKLAFIGINLDGKKLAKAIKKFMTDGRYRFINLFDELDGVNYKVADPYGITGTPTIYVIDMEGKVAYSVVGHLQPEELKQIIEGILGGN